MTDESKLAPDQELTVAATDEQRAALRAKFSEVADELVRADGPAKRIGLCPTV